MSNEEIHTQSPISFHHPIAFWVGFAAVVWGVVVHIPMFIHSSAMNYHMAGMDMGITMTIGMFAIIAGFFVVLYGLLPRDVFKSRQRTHESDDTHVQALDNAVLSPMHWKLFMVLIVALIVDVMKPAMLGFVVPGTVNEYGITKSHVALLPLFAITGTTLGSFLWGWLGDTIGRRASILLAAILFIGTSICGFMPSFTWNIIMCFIMGFSAGGMLPITFTLLAEIVPARHRGWMIVTLGAVGSLGGYLAASGSAALLEPIFGWRILWFLGLPTGLILILLNSFIPESPRFLLSHGYKEEAYRVMRKFGVEIAKGASVLPSTTLADITTLKGGNLAEIFRLPFTPLTMSVGMYGIAWGLVNFGFLLWLPLNLRGMGMGTAATDALLAKSAIIAFPVTLVGAWLYHKWSTKKTLVLFAMFTVITLTGFIVLGADLINNRLLLGAMLVALLVNSSCMIAMLSPYTAEMYPVRIRATASGWSAGCSKGAGVLTLGLVVAGLTPGLGTSAVIAATVTFLAAAAISWKGIETRGIGLEKIQEVSIGNKVPD